MKKSKKKVIIIVLIIFALLLIYGAYRRATRKFTSINDFLDVQEVVEYYKCEYISLKKSQKEGFDKDLKLRFPISPIDEVYGTSNQDIYERIINAVSAKLNYKSFRIIDESRDLVIESTYNKESNIVQYRINDDDNYFKNQYAKYSLNKRGESLEQKLEKNVTRGINSEALNKIINNNWKTTNSLGDKYKFSGTREIYWNQGFETRISGGSIIYIKYTTRYSGEIISDIKTGMDNSRIIEILGNPDYKQEVDKGSDGREATVIGYVINNCYFVFSKGEVFVSGIESNDESKDQELINAFSNMNKDGDYAKFVDKLTTIYTNYTTYISNENLIEIDYPTKGFKFTLGIYDVNNGLQIFDNYRGKLKSEDNELNNVSFFYEKNYMFEFIKQEIEIDDNNRMTYGDTDDNDKYNIITKDDEVLLYSFDKSYKDSRIIAKVSSIREYNDTTFIYSIDGNGIYKYSTETNESELLQKITGNISIEKIENNTVYYNNGNELKIK